MREFKPGVAMRPVLDVASLDSACFVASCSSRSRANHRQSLVYSRINNKALT